VIGSYGWTDRDGVLRLYDYLADEGGYRIVRERVLQLDRDEIPGAKRGVGLSSGEGSRSEFSWSRGGNRRSSVGNGGSNNGNGGAGGVYNDGTSSRHGEFILNNDGYVGSGSGNGEGKDLSSGGANTVDTRRHLNRLGSRRNPTRVQDFGKPASRVRYITRHRNNQRRFFNLNDARRKNYQKARAFSPNIRNADHEASEPSNVDQGHSNPNNLPVDLGNVDHSNPNNLPVDLGNDDQRYSKPNNSSVKTGSEILNENVLIPTPNEEIQEDTKPIFVQIEETTSANENPITETSDSLSNLGLDESPASVETKPSTGSPPLPIAFGKVRSLHHQINPKNTNNNLLSIPIQKVLSNPTENPIPPNSTKLENQKRRFQIKGRPLKYLIERSIPNSLSPKKQDHKGSIKGTLNDPIEAHNPNSVKPKSEHLNDPIRTTFKYQTEAHITNRFKQKALKGPVEIPNPNSSNRAKYQNPRSTNKGKKIRKVFVNKSYLEDSLLGSSSSLLYTYILNKGVAYHNNSYLLSTNNSVLDESDSNVSSAAVVVDYTVKDRHSVDSVSIIDATVINDRNNSINRVEVVVRSNNNNNNNTNSLKDLDGTTKDGNNNIDRVEDLGDHSNTRNNLDMVKDLGRTIHNTNDMDLNNPINSRESLAMMEDLGGTMNSTRGRLVVSAPRVRTNVRMDSTRIRLDRKPRLPMSRVLRMNTSFGVKSKNSNPGPVPDVKNSIRNLGGKSKSLKSEAPPTVGKSNRKFIGKFQEKNFPNIRHRNRQRLKSNLKEKDFENIRQVQHHEPQEDSNFENPLENFRRRILNLRKSFKQFRQIQNSNPRNSHFEKSQNFQLRNLNNFKIIQNSIEGKMEVVNATTNILMVNPKTLTSDPNVTLKDRNATLKDITDTTRESVVTLKDLNVTQSGHNVTLSNHSVTSTVPKTHLTDPKTHLTDPKTHLTDPKTHLTNFKIHLTNFKTPELIRRKRKNGKSIFLIKCSTYFLITV
jgi:hypothetical protein